MNSVSAQVSYYSALIQNNPEWEYAGVYADCGISARPVHAPRNLPQGNPVNVHLEHPADGLRLFRDDDIFFPILIIPVSEDMLVGRPDLAGRRTGS